MASRLPLVLVSGQKQQLQSGDLLDVNAIPGPVTLATGSSTSVASQVIDLSTFYTTYPTIEVHIIKLTAVTDNVSLNMLVSADGTNYDNASGNYEWQIYSGNTSTSANSGSNSAILMQLAAGIIGVGALSTASVIGRIYMNNLNDSTLLPTFNFMLSYVTTSTFLIATNTGSCTRTTAQITKSLKLSFSSGNISAIKWRVVGYK